MRNMETTTQIDPPGLSPKKTLFIMVTVVGCIAILWPKVFYPMMFGGPIKHNTIKDHRSGTEKLYKSTCCEVILDKDAFLNDSLTVRDRQYRKHINLYTGEIISLRQERPPHLRPDTIHPAMREKGRAIPVTPTIPIVERAKIPLSSPPRVVEGRPGPIPGMRPPLGAGSTHQTPQKTSSMGFIMPLYTVGIVAFFIYTIMKILFKKPVLNSPYGGTRSDPSFHKEVFGHEKSCCSGTKLVVTAIQGLIDAADEQLKIRENSTSLTKDTSENIQQQNSNSNNISNGHASPIQTSSNDLLSNNKLFNNDMRTEKHQQQQQQKTEQSLNENSNNNNNNNNNNYNDENLLTTDNRNDHHQLSDKDDDNHLIYYNNNETNNENLNSDNNDDNKKRAISHTAQTVTEQHPHQHHRQQHRTDNNENKFERKKLDGLDHHSERSVVVLGMELTASCEGGQKWNRPPTPVFIQHVEHSSLKDDVNEKQPDPQPIYLEGALPHESQILVADSKIERENIIIDDEHDCGSVDEPAVVLSSKMTLSLINLSSSDNYSSDENNKEYSSQEKDSPLDNDMEIINGEEQQEDKKESN